MKDTRCLSSIGALCALFFLASSPAGATIIAEHSGSTNPATEGFVVPPGYNSGNGAPVTNDLGLGINAWNVNGSWCCSGEAYDLSSAQVSTLTTTEWVFSVNMRDLSTTTSNTGYGPNSYGGVATTVANGLRFSIDLHSDGSGGQVLSADPFAAGPTYDIAGLGTGYALIQIAYDPTTKTADYYVNDVEVISGFAGYSNYYEPWVSFGAQDSNFNLVELETNAPVPGSSPEPSSWTLVASGGMVALGLVGRRKVFRKS
jgi:hypothetical protein